MKNLLGGVLAVIILVVGGYYLYSFYYTDEAVLEEEIGEEVLVSENEQEVKEYSVTPGFKYYSNEEWGFAFEYPDDWEVYEAYFGSPYSKFNAVVLPIARGQQDMPISINVVLPEFISGSFASYQDKKTPIIFKGREVDLYEYKWQEMDKTNLIMPFGEYSLILGSNHYYEEEFEHFLDTFEFLD